MHEFEQSRCSGKTYHRLEKLPLGTITAKGWLREQLMRNKAGMSDPLVYVLPVPAKWTEYEGRPITPLPEGWSWYEAVPDTDAPTCVSRICPEQQKERKQTDE